MRRILAGLEVVRPRCAAGAPPRPRLRSTAPYTDRNEANKHETTKDPTFTGVPNTDKETKPCGGGVSSVGPPKIGAKNATRSTLLATSGYLAVYKARPTRSAPTE